MDRLETVHLTLGIHRGTTGWVNLWGTETTSFKDNFIQQFESFKGVLCSRRCVSDREDNEESNFAISCCKLFTEIL
jgi:hypothetical protein